MSGGGAPSSGDSGGGAGALLPRAGFFSLAGPSRSPRPRAPAASAAPRRRRRGAESGGAAHGGAARGTKRVSQAVWAPQSGADTRSATHQMQKRAPRAQARGGGARLRRSGARRCASAARRPARRRAACRRPWQRRAVSQRPGARGERPLPRHQRVHCVGALLARGSVRSRLGHAASAPFPARRARAPLQAPCLPPPPSQRSPLLAWPQHGLHSGGSRFALWRSLPSPCSARWAHAAKCARTRRTS